MFAGRPVPENYKPIRKAEIMTKYSSVKKFNQEIIGLKPVNDCAEIELDRYTWFKNVINEELDELYNAWEDDDKVGILDALVDMAYFILGRVYEYGYTEEQWERAFYIVHNCNMTKHKGNKGRGSDDDAVKDDTWVGPEKVIEKMLNEDPLYINEPEGSMFKPILNHFNKLSQKDIITAKQAEDIAPIKCDENKCTNVEKHKPSVYLEQDGEQKILSIDELNLFAKMSPVFKEVTQLALKKSADYNGPKISRSIYFPFGLISYAQMLHVKTQRLISLANQNKEPNNESIRDTLLDMINYASFAVEAIDKGEI